MIQNEFIPGSEWRNAGIWLAINLASPQTIADNLKKEHIMKFQFGHSQLVVELSPSAFAWFHGHTQRMSLTSMTVLCVQVSFFARQPGLA